LPAGRTSDLLREWLERLAAYLPYKRAVGILSDIIGRSPCVGSLEENIREDGDVAEAYDKQQSPPPIAEEAQILVVQADGKGVPMVLEARSKDKVRRGKGDKPCRKREAIATAVYTIAPQVRTPRQVRDSLFKVEGAFTGARSRPCHKKLWATLSGRGFAIERLAKRSRARDGDHIRERVALTDGSENLQDHVIEKLPGFHLVLDVIHALEYLWEAANSLLGERSPERDGWVKKRALRMLRGHTAGLIKEFRQIASDPGCKDLAKTKLLAVAGYYERNLERMRYDHYLKSGWPIATGVIEGACRHLVKDRCELSGMRWSEPGAEVLLRLRSVAENGDWELFQAYRRGQRHQEYGEITPATRASLEKAATAGLNADRKAA
jgi:hypothetical protein